MNITATYIHPPYQEKPTGIVVLLNGTTSFVPIDPANTDYQQIMALVEAGELVIADPEPTGTTN